MNIIVTSIVIIIFLVLNISFIYVTWKHIDTLNTKFNRTKKDAIAQVAGRVLQDQQDIDHFVKTNNIVESTTKLDIIRKAVDIDKCTKEGEDMFSKGECHFCCDGLNSYINNTTHSLYCHSNENVPPSDTYTLFKQDVCTCTQETKDVHEASCCFPCCDGLNMYKNDKTNAFQCFKPGLKIDGYTEEATNTCDDKQPNKTKCPSFPPYKLIKYDKKYGDY
jgi:hypothetical protein